MNAQSAMSTAPTMESTVALSRGADHAAVSNTPAGMPSRTTETIRQARVARCSAITGIGFVGAHDPPGSLRTRLVAERHPAAEHRAALAAGRMHREQRQRRREYLGTPRRRVLQLELALKTPESLRRDVTRFARR